MVAAVLKRWVFADPSVTMAIEAKWTSTHEGASEYGPSKEMGNLSVLFFGRSSSLIMIAGKLRSSTACCCCGHALANSTKVPAIALPVAAATIMSCSRVRCLTVTLCPDVSHSFATGAGLPITGSEV